MHLVQLGVPGLSLSWVLCGYDAALGRVVRSAKAQADRAVMAEVGRVFAARVAAMVGGAPIEAVVAAPSSAWSRFRRGFSGAAVLADAVGAAVGARTRSALVRRGGGRQSGLSRAGRLANLAGRVRCDVELRGTVLLVDDVVTTGATAAACVNELLGAGATTVWLASVARVRDPPIKEGGFGSERSR